MLYVNGTPRQTPFSSVNWHDKPALRPISADYGPRPKKKDGKYRPAIQTILHGTVGGWPQTIKDALGPRTNRPVNVVSSWRRDGRSAAAHLIVDFDGVVYQCADLLSEVTWHCQGCNYRSIGIEIIEDSKNTMYRGQLAVVVDVCNWLCDLSSEEFLGQRIIPTAYAGALQRFAGLDNSDYYGFVGHRCRKERGRGDPGDEIFAQLEADGYEKFNLALNEDIAKWQERQRLVGVNADGLPGPGTRAAFAAYGKRNGIWTPAT